MRRFLPLEIGCFALVAALATAARAFEIKSVEAAPLSLASLDLDIGGRTVAKAESGGTMHRLQWPGVYFEAAFKGTEVYFETGEGKAIYHVAIDGETGGSDVKWTSSGAGWHQIDGLADGPHTIRIELATECQGGAVDFGGCFVPDRKDARPAPTLPSREIEFIGDSHTVGYGDTSTKRECTGDEVWLHTDTSQAFGPLVAKHYGATYRINAISGRGIIRNYNGGGGDPLPVAYPYALFDHSRPADDNGWNPQVIVIGLGTNDFSTPLKPDEKWKTREEEHADFERTYVAFVEQLRAKHLNALFILAANDMADGEIQAEVRKVVTQLAAKGDKRVEFAAFNQLELTGCNWHPSLADHRKMASVLTEIIDSHRDVWPK